jgi:hypothetical protein
MTTSVMIVPSTTASSCCEIIESGHSAMPAWQNAATAWNTPNHSASSRSIPCCENRSVKIPAPKASSVSVATTMKLASS